MKKEIHPDYHFVNIKMTDGTTFRTRSTYGKSEDNLTLDIDPLTHPAWTGGKASLNEAEGQVARFQKRFKGVKISK